MKMNQQDNFSIHSLKEFSLSEFAKSSTIHNSTQKASNLFQSLISTNIIDKSPFDFESYRENVFDFQPEQIDLLKLEEMLPRISITKNNYHPPFLNKQQNQHHQINLAISQKSEEDQSEYQGSERRKIKKGNRSVKGTTNNMLVIIKGMIKSYMRRENVYGDDDILPKGYLNMKKLQQLITSSTLKEVLHKMLQQRYLQRCIASSSISLQHKMLYLKKVKKFYKMGERIKNF